MDGVLHVQKSLLRQIDRVGMEVQHMPYGGATAKARSNELARHKGQKKNHVLIVGLEEKSPSL